jgi:hypothetical protein
MNVTIVRRLYALRILPHSSLWTCGFLCLYPHNKTLFVMGTIKPILIAEIVTIYKNLKSNGLCIYKNHSDMQYPCKVWSKIQTRFFSSATCTYSIVGVGGYCCIWSHTKTHHTKDTPHSVGLPWTCDRPVAEDCTCTTQNKHRRYIRAPGGIQTRNPSKRAAANTP